MLKNTKCVTYHLNQTLLFVLKTLIDLQNISVDVVYYMCFKINFTFPKLILDKMSLQNFKLPTSCIRIYLCTAFSYVPSAKLFKGYNCHSTVFILENV